MLVKYVGTYRGNVVEKGVSLTGKSKLPQFVARLQATEYYDEENEQWIDWTEYEETEITAYLVLFSKSGEPIFHIDNIKKAFGWSGASLKELDEMDVSSIPVQFRVEENEYEGKKTLQVSQIDHADAEPGRNIRRLDSDELKKLDAKFATTLRKVSGGPKPKSVPAKPQATKEDPKAAAKKKYEDKKNRGQEAEKKAKPKVPEVPKVPKPTEPEPTPDPISVAESLKLPAICTKEEAWEACCTHRNKAVTDEQIAQKWNDAIDEQGGEDAIDKEHLWSTVRDVILEDVGDSEIPF